MITKEEKKDNKKRVRYILGEFYDGVINPDELNRMREYLWDNVASFTSELTIAEKKQYRTELKERGFLDN